VLVGVGAAIAAPIRLRGGCGIRLVILRVIGTLHIVVVALIRQPLGDGMVMVAGDPIDGQVARVASEGRQRF